MSATRFGQLSLWCLIACGVYYTLKVQIEPRTLEHILSPAALLPAEIWQSESIFSIFKIISICGLILWALNVYVPIVAVIGALGFTSVNAFSVTGQIYVRHQPHVINMLLIFYTLWALTRSKEQHAAPRFWGIGRVAPYPVWLYTLCVFYISTTYTFSGLTKILYSGLDWPNGVSLQLWCWGGAEYGNIARSLCLFDSRIAATLQAIVLLAESTCLLAYRFPRLRPLYGITLIGFHLSVEILFDLRFYGNIFADFIFFVAAPRVLGAQTFGLLLAKREEKSTAMMKRQTKGLRSQ